MTQEFFAQKIGLKQNYLSMIERGISHPHPRTINAVCARLGIRPAWLAFGEEPVYHEHTKENGMAYKYTIPIITSAAANPQSRIEFEAIEDEWTRFQPGLIAIRIQDESMSPIAWPGQLVICDPEASIKDGDLAVVKIKHRGTMFKRVHFDKKHGLVVLQSINPARDEPPLNIMKEDVEFQYKVIAVKFE